MWKYALALSALLACNSKAITGEACTKTDDCVGGKFCINQVCAASFCSSNTECAAKQVCTSSGTCVTFSGAGSPEPPQITTIAGDGTGGKIASALVVTGLRFDGASVAELRTADAKSLVSSLQIVTTTATQLTLGLPASVAAGTYSLGIETAAGVARADIQFVVGETGAIGAQGPAGIAGVAGLPGPDGVADASAIASGVLGPTNFSAVADLLAEGVFSVASASDPTRVRMSAPSLAGVSAGVLAVSATASSVTAFAISGQAFNGGNSYAAITEGTNTVDDPQYLTTTFFHGASRDKDGGLSAQKTFALRSNGDLEMFTSSGVRKVWIEASTGIGRFNGGVQASGADLAELVPSNEALSAGDVVEMQQGIHAGKSHAARSTKVLGVVSTKPGAKIGAPEGAIGTYVALRGRAPVRTNNQGGPIKIGDALVSSDEAGVAMRCAKLEACQGAIIGKAMEPMKGASGSIMVWLNLQ